MQHQLLREYNQALPVYDLVAKEAAETLENLRCDPTVKIHSISHRIKSKDSFSKKLGRPDRIYKKLNDVTDIVGFRIITYFEDGIDDAAQFVEKHFSLDLRKSEDKRLKSSLDQFGYRSLHYVCRPTISFFDEHELAFDPDLCFEIQIRTILEHAWAEIEHDLGYKSPLGVPASIRRRFSRLSGLLELADQEFVAIKESLMTYEAEAAKKITEATDDLPIDSVTLKAFLDEGETTQTEVRIAQELGVETSSQLFFVDYLVYINASSKVLWSLFIGLDFPVLLSTKTSTICPLAAAASLFGPNKAISNTMLELPNFATRKPASITSGKLRG